MAMRVSPKVFLFYRVATNRCGCDETLDFARLIAILAKTVKKANKTHSDGSGFQQIGRPSTFPMNGTSRVTGDSQARFSKRLGVKVPEPTRRSSAMIVPSVTCVL